VKEVPWWIRRWRRGWFRCEVCRKWIHFDATGIYTVVSRGRKATTVGLCREHEDIPFRCGD
jgi:hypothetical protein